jgi:hypothetical protein
MKYSIREIYFYLVSLVMLIIIVFNLFSLVNGIIEWFEPQQLHIEAKYLRTRLEDENPDATEEELDQLVADEAERRREQEEARREFYRWKRIAQPVIAIVIAFPIYLYHWRRAQGHSEERTDSSQAAEVEE